VVDRGVERVPQDARGAPRARGVRAGHDGGAQGAGDDHRPLPPLRLPPPLAGADRQRPAPGRGRGRHRDPRARRPHDRPRRHLFVVQTLGAVPESFAVTSEHTDRLAAQAARMNQAEILRAIDLLAAGIAAVKDGSEPRIQLEMALLKASQPSSDLSLQALMFRIEQLEARIAGGAVATPAGSDAPAPAPEAKA